MFSNGHLSNSIVGVQEARPMRMRFQRRKFYFLKKNMEETDASKKKKKKIPAPTGDGPRRASTQHVLGDKILVDEEENNESDVDFDSEVDVDTSHLVADPMVDQRKNIAAFNSDILYDGRQRSLTEGTSQQETKGRAAG